MTSATVGLARGAHRSIDAASKSLRTLCVLFFLSGFPALIYQLAWQRALFRIFGVNIESVTIIVTAFMLGLGFGSMAGGWLSQYRALPLLVLLAAIEGLTGLFGFFSLSIFEHVGSRVLGAPLPLTAVICLVLVMVPTLLMGATLPLLVGHLLRRSGNVGNIVGRLYHVNTLGAGAACLVCAVVFFPFLGLQKSVLVAVLLNAAVAVGAVVAHLRDPEPLAQIQPDGMAASGVADQRPNRLYLAVLAMAGVSGLICLSYEIFFFRAMSYATGSSPFAFATTLGALLVGLASGARLGGEACTNHGVDQLLTKIQNNVLYASFFGFAFLPLLSHLAWLSGAVLGVGLMLVFLMALNWGQVLPCLAHIGLTAGKQAGVRTGLLYLCNIIGSSAGSVLTGFVLMDQFGLVEIAQVLLGAGILFAMLVKSTTHERPTLKKVRIGLVGLAGILGVLCLPAATGNVLEALQWANASEAKTQFSRVVENRSGIVTVDSTGTVFGNGAYDGHFNVDLVNDLNGIVRPYALSLFHPAPRDVLMIGFASGSWAQVLANNPEVNTLTIVEINPGYTGLVARNAAVASVLTHPKVRLVTDDGRRWLSLNANRRFDAVVINSTFHFRANATNLLSAEFLQLLKAHLNPGGIAFYNTTNSSRVQRTGCATFEFGARFTNHMVLSTKPISWNFDRWKKVLAAYRIDGHPTLDLTRMNDLRALERLMALEAQTLPNAPPAADSWIESCDRIMARTIGRLLVTDDNMGTEWRQFMEAP